MKQFQVLTIVSLMVMALSCGNSKPMEFDSDLEMEEPSVVMPRPLEEMEIPEFDYSEIIERFKKGERIGAAALIDDYADKLEDLRMALKGDQKVDVRSIIEDMQIMAREVRSKNIVDADELLSECMIIDRDIAEVFVKDDDTESNGDEIDMLKDELNIVISSLRSSLPELTVDQRKIANQMIKTASPLLKGDAVQADDWVKTVNDQIAYIEDWMLDNLPEDVE